MENRQGTPHATTYTSNRLAGATTDESSLDDRHSGPSGQADSSETGIDGLAV